MRTIVLRAIPVVMSLWLAGAAQAQIKIGVAGPITGANASFGAQLTQVVGHFNSGVTIPASDVYSENGILFITPSATNPKVTDRMLWDAFRTCGRDDQQGMLWAELARA